MHVLDDLSTGSQTNFLNFVTHPHFQFTLADILTYPEIESAVAKADCIYHLAAVVGVFHVLHASDRVFSVNIIGTERLLHAVSVSQKKPRVILASTSEVYGAAHDIPLIENSPLIISSEVHSRSLYAVSKIALEASGICYYQKYHIPITVVRLFNTIGPRQMSQYGMVVPRFVKLALAHQPITVYGTGQQTRSFIDIRDSVILLNQIALNQETIGKTINVGCDQEISMNHLAKLVKKIAHSDASIQHISYQEAYGEDFEEFVHRKPDLTLLKSYTRHVPRYQIEDTLTELVGHHKR